MSTTSMPPAAGDLPTTDVEHVVDPALRELTVAARGYQAMALELSMVGVIVEDMARAAEFYRRLGVEVPEGADKAEHVEMEMGGITFFLNTKSSTARGTRRGRRQRVATSSYSSSSCPTRPRSQEVRRAHWSRLRRGSRAV
jgi:hypothetical protein